MELISEKDRKSAFPFKNEKRRRAGNMSFA